MSEDKSPKVYLYYDGANAIIKSPEYRCPKHGIIDSVLTSYIKEIPGNWCMKCYLENLDKCGVCRVEEII